MTRGFDHQDQSLNVCLPKSAPKPQHGQMADAKAKVKERRTFAPRAGH